MSFSDYKKPVLSTKSGSQNDGYSTSSIPRSQLSTASRKSNASRASQQSENSITSSISNHHTAPVDGDEAAQTAKIIQKHFNHIKVGVRLAPMSASDIQNQVRCTVEVKPPQSLISYYPESGEGLLYDFDFVFEQRTPFNDIFKRIGYPAVNCFLEGYNSSVISYGASRSGKTEFLFGNDEETGLITNSLKEAFTYLANAPDYITYTVIFSFWEMNNNQVIDLLNPIASKTKTGIAGMKSKTEYKPRRHPEYGVYLTNLSEVEVRSWDELEELIESGTTLSQKLAHQRGIRWHSFLKLTLIREDAHQPERTVRSTLSFINLKGTDRIGSMGAKGELLKQGASLNQSITSLGSCIHNVVSYTRKKLAQAQSLQEAENMKKNFPREIYGMFGDSKLLMMLSDSLSGNTCTTIVCSISPTEYHYLETMDALENIRVISNIPALPQRGDVHTEAYRLQKQIEKLRKSIPESSLKDDRPLTEKEEKLKMLEIRFKEIISGVVEKTHRQLPSQIMKDLQSTKIEPNKLEIPIDADAKLWKKNQVQSLKHGSRHTFYFPQQKRLKNGKIETNTTWIYKGQWHGDQQGGEGIIENDKVKYSGGWKEGNYDGYGILWLKNKKKTKSNSLTQTSKSVKSSTSKIQSASIYTRVYAGNWKGGLKHGEGIYYYKNGDIYEGEWENDLRSGEGTMHYVDGSKYTGEWADDQCNGFGVLHENNGNRYEGYFLNGKKHGSGSYYYVSQCRLYKGEWIEGVAKCGVISDFNKDVDESDAEIERITGEVILIPKIGLQDYHQILEQMKISLQNEWRMKHERDNQTEEKEEIETEIDPDDQFENLLKQRIEGGNDDFNPLDNNDIDPFNSSFASDQGNIINTRYGSDEYQNERYNNRESYEIESNTRYENNEDQLEEASELHSTEADGDRYEKESLSEYDQDVQVDNSFDKDVSHSIDDTYEEEEDVKEDLSQEGDEKQIEYDANEDASEQEIDENEENEELETEEVEEAEENEVVEEVEETEENEENDENDENDDEAEEDEEVEGSDIDDEDD